MPETRESESATKIDPLARIIVEDLLVFAYCTDDEIDDDFACEQLERIAHEIRSAGESVVVEFLQTMERMRREAETQGESERAERLESMPSHMGLA